jgi:hypothetical protein
VRRSEGNAVLPWERIALGSILVVTCTLLVYLAWRTGITVDEPAHLVSAHLYWQGRDRLAPGDMPPLIKIVGGWSTAGTALPLPEHLGDPGETRHEWPVSLAMMERLQPPRIGRIMFLTRLPMVIFPLMTIGLLWWWARQLFSPVTALLTAALFALEPTALAHGAIFKNDHAATFAYLLFWFAVWRYWRVPSIRSAMLIAIAIGLCMLAKLSLLFLFAAGPLLILIRRPRWGTAAIASATCAIVYALVLAASEFQARLLTVTDIAQLSANKSIPRWFALVSHVFTIIPVPARMWAGTVALMSGLGYEMPVYFFGSIWPHGHPLYFLGAVAVKAPVTLIAFGFTGAALLAVALWRRQLAWTDVFWIVPGPLYVFLASRVPLQLGVRLILPALPFGLLVVSYAIERLRRERAGRAFVAAGLALFAFEAVRVYPFGMVFFNVAAGGPSAGDRYLADSNLDWGQGLGELARWARAHQAGRVRLSYFGTDMMYRYFRDEEVQPIAPPWNAALAKGPELIPEPGHYYAISPTLLPGQFFAPKYHDYYARFRAMEPVARPGYSIFVYRVDAPPR